MTSLFSRFQKLNKERNEGWVTLETSRVEAEFSNSLPAVLNLIEAAQAVTEAVRDPMDGDIQDLRAAVAVFVSGQEEPK